MYYRLFNISAITFIDHCGITWLELMFRHELTKFIMFKGDE